MAAVVVLPMATRWYSVLEKKKRGVNKKGHFQQKKKKKGYFSKFFFLFFLPALSGSFIKILEKGRDDIETKKKEET